jgi:hypothetical protein
MEAQLTSENCVSLTPSKGYVAKVNLAKVPSSLCLMKIEINAKGNVFPGD